MPSSPRNYALRLIKQRLRSRFELEQALLRRKVTPEDIATVLDDLQQAGLIDDSRFARAWVHDRDNFSPRGTFVLKRELSKKGIARDLIDQILQERKDQEEPVDEFQQALDLTEGRRRRWSVLPTETRKRRLASFLTRRGFSMDTVRRILNV